MEQKTTGQQRSYFPCDFLIFATQNSSIIYESRGKYHDKNGTCISIKSRDNAQLLIKAYLCEDIIFTAQALQLFQRAESMKSGTFLTFINTRP